MGYIKLPGTMGHSGGKLIYSTIQKQSINIISAIRFAMLVNIPSAQPFPKAKS